MRRAPAGVGGLGAALKPAMKTRQQLIEEREMAEQMAKLKLVKERREQQRLERIKAEGWDRFAPLTDDNHPPGTAPPSKLDSSH